jgi:phosphatidylethanolamine-binding protein (PEBP) family uncharacterized protein
MGKISALLMTTICAFVLSACVKNDNEDLHVEGFVLTSSAMTSGGQLPVTYTCDGESVSPPFSWVGAPELTQYYALVMHHDAPDGVHWYWTMYNIPSNKSLINIGEILGEIGGNSVNDLLRYAPPCSKGPGEKAYQFTLYALSTAAKVNHEKPVDRATLLAAIKGITLGATTMTVTYTRDSNKADVQPKDRAKPEINSKAEDKI